MTACDTTPTDDDRMRPGAGGEDGGTGVVDPLASAKARHDRRHSGKEEGPAAPEGKRGKRKEYNPDHELVVRAKRVATEKLAYLDRFQTTHKLSFFRDLYFVGRDGDYHSLEELRREVLKKEPDGRIRFIHNHKGNPYSPPIGPDGQPVNIPQPPANLQEGVEYVYDPVEDEFMVLSEYRRPNGHDRFDPLYVKEEDGSYTPIEDTSIALSGRAMRWGAHGGIIFGILRAGEGAIQIAFHREDFPDEESWDRNTAYLMSSDILGVTGRLEVSKTLVPTLRVSEAAVLTPAIRPSPPKTPVDDVLARQYEAKLLCPETRGDTIWIVLKLMPLIKKAFREYLSGEEDPPRLEGMRKTIATGPKVFSELDIPVLTAVPSGAQARAFETQSTALNGTIYLNIAPEIPLKRALIGLESSVFTICRAFRNEGISPEHNPEFELLEYYGRGWDYLDNLKFTVGLLSYVIKKVNNGSLQVPYYDPADPEFPDSEPITLDFSSFEDFERVRRVTFRELFLGETDIDLADPDAETRLRQYAAGVDISEDKITGSFGALVDEVYKKLIRPKLVQPIVITNQLSEMAPLAKPDRENPLFAQMYQIVVAGTEIVKAYSEETDPRIQKERLEEQQKHREAGEAEAMPIDHDYINAMLYGLPPCAGTGIGISRLAMLIAGIPVKNIQETGFGLNLVRPPSDAERALVDRIIELMKPGNAEALE